MQHLVIIRNGHPHTKKTEYVGVIQKNTYTGNEKSGSSIKLPLISWFFIMRFTFDSFINCGLNGFICILKIVLVIF